MHPNPPTPKFSFSLDFGHFILKMLENANNFNPRPHLLFHQTRTHLGGGGTATPRAISLLRGIELRDKDQQIDWDVPNPKVCELTDLGQPLTFQVRSSKKCSVFPGRQFRQVFRQ